MAQAGKLKLSRAAAIRRSAYVVKTDKYCGLTVNPQGGEGGGLKSRNEVSRKQIGGGGVVNAEGRKLKF